MFIRNEIEREGLGRNHLVQCMGGPFVTSWVVMLKSGVNCKIGSLVASWH